jgi:cytochrome c-type biogenesis protein
MIFFLISVIAGVLTVLAPCILPLLPIVIGTSDSKKRSISRKSLVVIGSLCISIIVFTLLLKATTLLIQIPQSFWNLFSGTLICFVGITMVFPTLWSRLKFVQKIHQKSSQAMSVGFGLKNDTGDVLIGLALGPVFSTCSPTYLFIIATILPSNLAEGLIYLVGFTLGLAVSLLLIAFFGGLIIKKIMLHAGLASKFKQIMGILIIMVGISIITGLDKKIESAILDLGYGATIQLEESLIKKHFFPN